MTDRRPETRRQRQPRRQGRAPAAPAPPAASVDDDNKGIDLDITLNNSRLEQIANSTRRPEIEPTDAVGTQFEPFYVPDRDFQVLELPVSPLKLFQHFLPVWLVERWVDYTNNNPAAADPDDPALS